MKKLHIGILVLIMVLVVALSGCTNSNTGSNTGSNTSSGNGSSNATGANDISIVIKYPGNWACDVSGTFGYRSLSGSGDQTTNMGSISGAITAAARKTEGGNEMLTVSITKGGNTIASQSTTAPYGGASAVATGV